MEHLEILEGRIPTKIYQHLREVCGLSPKTEAACEIGLNHSVYAVMVKKGEAVIGMGRIIGDGGCFCQVVDICVIPPCQGIGIGKLIMDKIAAYIHDHLPESCYISLMADGDAAYLYEKYGFRDTLPKSKGMYLKK